MTSSTALCYALVMSDIVNNEHKINPINIAYIDDQRLKLEIVADDVKEKAPNADETASGSSS